MFALDNFVKVGEIKDLEKNGWLRISAIGRDLLITYIDNELIAMEVNRKNDKSIYASLPYEFHPESNTLENMLMEPIDDAWGTLKCYPVHINGNDLLLGTIPLN